MILPYLPSGLLNRGFCGIANGIVSQKTKADSHLVEFNDRVSKPHRAPRARNVSVRRCGARVSTIADVANCNLAESATSVRILTKASAVHDDRTLVIRTRISICRTWRIHISDTIDGRERGPWKLKKQPGDQKARGDTH
jgi:hypothetical protein